MVISDCRVSWSTSLVRLQDNLQKVYPCGPTGVIAFAGGITAAKAIFRHINQEVPKKRLPPSARDIAIDIADWAKQAYAKLPTRDQVKVELMYAAADYRQVTSIASNVVFAENILSKMISPDFEPIFQKDAVCLGYAVKYATEDIRQIRDSLLNIALEPNDLRFQAGIAVNAVGGILASLGDDAVGGVFSVGIINANGVFWFPYGGHSNGLELKIEDERFVQYDYRDGRRVPLKTIFEFDVNRPDAGDLHIKKPDD